jgi:NHS family xanthosine MFS transporter
MLLGASLQLTNMYGDVFLSEFELIPEYANSFVVKYSTIIMSISQMSETLFILTIPFFLKRFGIKNVMLFSMFAWVLRFGLFGFGNPTDGLWMIILSMIIYGMAFDFFNISGSLFVETQTDPKMRASAQGLFMMMTNGFGTMIGAWGSGIIIQKFFVLADGSRDWHNIWIAFAGYALVVGILFALLFKHKHNPKEIENFVH